MVANEYSLESSSSDEQGLPRGVESNDIIQEREVQIFSRDFIKKKIREHSSGEEIQFKF
jgi:hypothetical protein